MKIPFNKAQFGPEEIEAAVEVLRSGVVGGNGPVGRSVEALLREMLGVEHALLTTSCTHALELAFMVLDIGPGDEVLLPSFTFVSTANAILRCRARPVFVDIDEASLMLDPQKVKEAITPKTKAIICVHYARLAAPMEALLDIADRHRLTLIEDAAQGIGARWNERALGTIGDFGCISFHETKNIVCGEGGVLLLHDDRWARQAEIMREKGTNRSAFLRGEVDKYLWLAMGSSYVLSEVLAAILLKQLQKVDAITERRRAIFDWYYDRLQGMAKEGRLTLQSTPEGSEPNGHIFAFRVRDESERDRCLAEMRNRGIHATFHYVPLHSSPFGQDELGYRPEDLPVTERVAKTLTRLPLYPGLTEPELNYIVEVLDELLP